MTSMYNTQNYWIFVLCPSSDILKRMEQHNVLETGFLTILRWGENIYSVGPVNEVSTLWGPQQGLSPHPHHQLTKIEPVFEMLGAHGSVVVKALCYKREGRRFETRWGEWFLSSYPILPVALGPGDYSASNRNEYQRHKYNVSGE
jgi:hypothetical protein